MAGTITYVSVAVTFIILAIFFVIAIIQHSVDESHLIRTPNIPLENAVITSIASTRIRGSPDEVFSTMVKFKNSPDVSPISNFEWKDKSEDGVPRVGSTGSFRLDVDGFPARLVSVKLTLLDPERRKLAYSSVRYPPWLLGSERVIEILPVEGHSNLCDYRSYQTLEGIAAYYLMLTARAELAETEKRLGEDLRVLIENGNR